MCSQKSGFRSKHSTVAALVNLRDQLLQNMTDGTLTGTIFIDLRKAFDTMDHSHPATEAEKLWCRRPRAPVVLPRIWMGADNK